jgi:RHS repeat-associated protein
MKAMKTVVLGAPTSERNGRIGVLRLLTLLLSLVSILPSPGLAQNNCSRLNYRLEPNKGKLTPCNPYGGSIAVADGGSSQLVTISWSLRDTSGSCAISVDDSSNPPTSASVYIRDPSNCRSGTATLVATVTCTCSWGHEGEWPTYEVTSDWEVECPDDDDDGGGGSGPGGGGGCGSTCRRGGSADSFAPTLGEGPAFNKAGPDFQLQLGRHDSEEDAGYLSFWSRTPGAVTPAALSVPLKRAQVQVFPASGTFEQVKSPQGLVRVANQGANAFDLQVFYSQDVEWNGGTGRYQPIAGRSPFTTWTISNPGGDANQVRFLQSGGGARQFNYSYNAGNARWTSSTPSDPRTVTSWRTVNGNFIYKTTEVRSNSALVKKVYRTYETVGGRVAPTRVEDGEGTAMRVTVHTPYRNTGYPLMDGLTKRTDYPDGRWEMFEYDELGRVTVHYESYLDTAPPTGASLPAAGTCRKTCYTYDPQVLEDMGYQAEHPRLTQVYLPFNNQGSWQWVEVSRTYWAAFSVYETEVQRCPDPVQCTGWDHTGHLVTSETRYDAQTDPQERVKWVTQPDGTATYYQYVAVTGGTNTIVQVGEPNAQLTAIVNGTQTETVHDAVGRVLSVTTKAIQNSQPASTVLAQQTYTYGGDPLLRDYQVVDLGNRTTTYDFECCGLSSTVDPDGVTTTYEYDSLKRQVAATTLYGASGIKMTNILDANGQVLETRRISSVDGTSMTLAQYQYDVLGRLTKETNALGGETAYTETMVNNKLQRTTTYYPDGGTRIETYYRDGRLEKVTGTAVAPVRYDYVVEDVGPSPTVAWQEYALETKLDAGGNPTSEWTRRYIDSLGRSCRTVYAKATTPYPYSAQVFNDKGQLTQQRDPDGVTTLFAHNAKGERVRTAVDLNQNQAIDPTGSDRITDVIQDVLPYSDPNNSRGTDIVRTRTFKFVADGVVTTNLVAMTEAATDGLRTWSTAYKDGSTAVTTLSQTAYGTGGSRTETTTNPDASKTETTYSYSRRSTIARKNSAGGTVTQTTYAYDNHGRVASTTDPRNGATSFTYNTADQVLTTTTPAPGAGDPAQVTTAFYNAQLRSTGQLLPDGTTTTNQYLVTGLLQKTWGSRTYPVEYTYDLQGRMKTMKTWQGFAAGSGTATTTWNYDLYRGWLASKDYPDASTGNPGTAGPTYTYKDSGRLLTRLWERGVTTTYAYNNAGDLNSVTYTGGSVSTPSTTYTYDRRGRRATVVCNNITTTFTYNEADLPLTEVYSGTGTLTGLSANNTYDNYLRRDTVNIKNGGTVLQAAGFAYDTAGRLETVTDASATAYTAVYTYLTSSPLVSRIAFKENTTTRMTTAKAYDKLDRLQSISSTLAGTSAPSLPVGFQYQYNPANQRIRRTDSDSSYWVYQYDALGQVTSGRRFWADGTPVDGQQFDYVFDDIGNRKSTGGRASAVSTYNPNRLNQYFSRITSNPATIDVLGIANPTQGVTVNGNTANRKGEYFHWPLTVANGTAQYPTVNVVSLYGAQQTDSGKVFVPPATESYGYDTDGNLTSDGRWSYSWDGENRLVEMKRDTDTPTGGRQKLAFEYDHQGRRIRKQFFTYSGGWVEQTDTIFLYDGWNMMGELNANASNAKLRTYVWGLDLSGTMQGAGGVGGLLKVTDYVGSTTHHFVAYDGNGNVAALADGTSGALTARYEYGPFGEAIRTTGPATPPMAEKNPFRFSTKYTDDQSGFLYYGYRFYNASTGRWLSRDPLTLPGFVALPARARRPASLDSYGLTENNSVSSADYLGLLTFKVQDCQGCNAGIILPWGGETLGYWHDPEETDPWCKSVWEETEDLSFGFFKHSCGNTVLSEGLCNTQTHIKVKALNKGCCRRWGISCEYRYSGAAFGASYGRVLVTATFLGKEVASAFDGMPANGKSMASVDKYDYVYGEKVIRTGQEVEIFTLMPSVTAARKPNGITEEASVSCFAMCVDKN